MTTETLEAAPRVTGTASEGTTATTTAADVCSSTPSVPDGAVGVKGAGHRKRRQKQEPLDARAVTADVQRVSLEPPHYRVQSASDPSGETYYTVKRLDGQWYCTCPAGSHSRLCYHVRDAVAPRYLRDRLRQNRLLRAELHDMIYQPLVPTAPRYQMALLQGSYGEAGVFGPEAGS